MRRLMLFSSFMILMFFANAQITILSTDMPKVNDTLRYSTSSSTLNLTATGANQTWNYANMVISGQDLEKYYAPINTPYVLQFLSATYGMKENNLNTAAGVIQNPFSFFKTSTTAHVIVGRGATFQSLPLGFTYAPRDTQYKFPMNFGDTLFGNFYGTAGLAGVGSLVQTGTRSSKVDGWGSLTTPYGTYNCLRIKSVITETDSIVFGTTTLPIPNNRTEYVWLTKTEKFPILQVSVAGATGTQTIQFKDRYRPEAFVNNANFIANKTIAVNTDTINLLDQSKGAPVTWNWQITPSTGFTFVASTNATTQNPRVIFQNPGTYTVKLSVTYAGGADDTTKVNYITISSKNGLSTSLSEFFHVDLYPNPSLETLNISNFGSVQPQLTVLNLLGEVLPIPALNNQDHHLIQLDTRGLHSGMYYIVIDNGTSRITKKFQVQ